MELLRRRFEAASPQALWNRATLEAAWATGKERMVPLPTPVPVHLLYWTAWVEAGAEEGSRSVVNFRNDPYGRDARLETALTAAAEQAAGDRL